ncbi:unnamed protein product [Phytomonas sp. Hart1]|nr:unnamed protein product [Phytomonas sp. Hart1]|eukprot:CCW70555.1 unnamed protein product [Phytomonas sp. isolate Hart1]
MLVKSVYRCVLPVVRATILRPTCCFSIAQVRRPSVCIENSLPTFLIDADKPPLLECGTGQPAQRGRRKPLVWKRRHPWFDRQWSLDLKRIKKGPETPHFPEGVPFTPIRAFQSFSGRSWKINAGRRRKIRLSLKRGRKKLL